MKLLCALDVLCAVFLSFNVFEEVLWFHYGFGLVALVSLGYLPVF